MPLNPSLSDVLSRFASLSQLTGNDLDRFSFLCSDALSSVLNARRSDDPLSDDEAALLGNAAAALAFYHFALLSAAVPNPDFSAADVRVSYPKPDLNAAKTLCQDARALAAPLLKDQNFSFLSFRGDVP